MRKRQRKKNLKKGWISLKRFSRRHEYKQDRIDMLNTGEFGIIFGMRIITHDDTPKYGKINLKETTENGTATA